MQPSWNGDDRQVDITLANQNRAACKTAIENLLVQAPAYSAVVLQEADVVSIRYQEQVLFLSVSVGEVLEPFASPCSSPSSGIGHLAMTEFHFHTIGLVYARESVHFYTK